MPTNSNPIAPIVDANGFHGGECIRALDALQRELAERGVSFHVDSRQRKDRAPAIDDPAMPQVICTVAPSPEPNIRQST